jgi:dTDP-4-dehydrorhamnose 3,5-epimerase
MPFTFEKTFIEGLLVVTPEVFTDDRGHFLECYKADEFAAAGISDAFVQDNHSRSGRRVLRGLHCQAAPHSQSKLVRVTSGLVWDVAVDLRKGSPTFGRWFGLELGAENLRMLYIPQGFANGFLALTEGAEVQYKCGSRYRPESERGIRWDDPDLAIDWPLRDVVLSGKDAALPFFRDIVGKFA